MLHEEKTVVHESLLPWEQGEEVVGLRMRELNLGFCYLFCFPFIHRHSEEEKIKLFLNYPLKKWLNWNTWIFIQILYCSPGQSMVNYENYILFPCIQTHYNVMVQTLNSRVVPLSLHATCFDQAEVWKALSIGHSLFSLWETVADMWQSLGYPDERRDT